MQLQIFKFLTYQNGNISNSYPLFKVLTYIPNCLFNISTWISHGHLKLKADKTWLSTELLKTKSGHHP